ncbi:hypothetical protein A8C58_14670 [Enterococcus faecium]|nr:hypothetical protein A8C58_14670 [Enterococcus faecium]
MRGVRQHGHGSVRGEGGREEKRPAAASGEGGTTQQNEGRRRRQGRPKRAPPGRGSSQGTERPLGRRTGQGTRGKTGGNHTAPLP